MGPQTETGRQAGLWELSRKGRPSIPVSVGWRCRRELAVSKYLKGRKKDA